MEKQAFLLTKSLLTGTELSLFPLEVKGMNLVCDNLSQIVNDALTVIETVRGFEIS